MNMFLKADSVRVDSDEKGFALVIDTEDGDKLYVNIHPCALDFYDSVRNEMRQWVAEADNARLTLPPPEGDEVLFGAYALDDPKHPTYHERMVGDV